MSDIPKFGGYRSLWGGLGGDRLVFAILSKMMRSVCGFFTYGPPILSVTERQLPRFMQDKLWEKVIKKRNFGRLEVFPDCI